MADLIGSISLQMSSRVKDRVQIATIGKVVGLSGELKLHLESDFLEQFREGEEFFLDDGKIVTIESYNPKRSLVKFLHYNIREDAKLLTNKHLFTTKVRSKEVCSLNDGEYFWFDVIGSVVVDCKLTLGKVVQIDRIADVDYLLIKTDKNLLDKYPKEFMIPYIDRYIESFDSDSKILYTIDGLLLLEAS